MQIIKDSEFSPEGLTDGVFYLKLIGITAKALLNKPNPNDIIGFYIVGSTDEMRTQLHKFIDQACDAWEKASNEQKE